MRRLTQPSSAGARRGTVVLVDDSGREIEVADKIAAHRGEGRLHRAFTCLLFDEQKRLLLGRRALGKLLWPGYWDATVASHPARGESDLDATARRVHEELAVKATNLIRPAAINYHARYDAHWSEREFCAVLLGRLAGSPTPVAGQIDDLAWVPIDKLAEFTATRPVTPWFLLAWEKLNQDHAGELRRWLG